MAIRGRRKAKWQLSPCTNFFLLLAPWTVDCAQCDVISALYVAWLFTPDLILHAIPNRQALADLCMLNLITKFNLSFVRIHGCCQFQGQQPNAMPEPDLHINPYQASTHSPLDVTETQLHSLRRNCLHGRMGTRALCMGARRHGCEGVYGHSVLGQDASGQAASHNT